jgi:hypothetical protein
VTLFGVPATRPPVFGVPLARLISPTQSINLFHSISDLARRRPNCRSLFDATAGMPCCSAIEITTLASSRTAARDGRAPLGRAKPKALARRLRRRWGDLRRQGAEIFRKRISEIRECAAVHLRLTRRLFIPRAVEMVAAYPYGRDWRSPSAAGAQKALPLSRNRSELSGAFSRSHKFS